MTNPPKIGVWGKSSTQNQVALLARSAREGDNLGSPKIQYKALDGVDVFFSSADIAPLRTISSSARRSSLKSTSDEEADRTMVTEVLDHEQAAYSGILEGARGESFVIFLSRTRFGFRLTFFFCL